MWTLTFTKIYTHTPPTGHSLKWFYTHSLSEVQKHLSQTSTHIYSIAYFLWVIEKVFLLIRSKAGVVLSWIYDVNSICEEWKAIEYIYFHLSPSLFWGMVHMHALWNNILPTMCGYRYCPYKGTSDMITPMMSWYYVMCSSPRHTHKSRTGTVWKSIMGYSSHALLHPYGEHCNYYCKICLHYQLLKVSLLILLPLLFTWFLLEIAKELVFSTSLHLHYANNEPPLKNMSLHTKCEILHPMVNPTCMILLSN